MHLISKQEAQNQGLRYYFTNIPCKHGHHSERKVADGACKECVRLAHYVYYANHRTQALRVISNWQKQNRDKVNLISQTYRANNPVASAHSTHKYYLKNKQTWLANTKKWREANNAILRLYNAKRRSQVKLATPKWADVQKMLDIYSESVELTKSTGVKHEVDHIIPLTSDIVCGLHCEHNLRVITKTENNNKSNKHQP